MEKVWYLLVTPEQLEKIRKDTKTWQKLKAKGKKCS